MTDGPVRLTRRHFLRGALALAALPPLRGMASPHTPPLRVQGINHVSLQVRDVGRSRDFYQALFGMPVQAWQGPTPCLRIGDGPAFLALAPAPGVTPGIHHLCLAIENRNPNADHSRKRSERSNSRRKVLCKKICLEKLCPDL